MPNAYLAQQGEPFALLRVTVLVEWESPTRPATLTATFESATYTVPTEATRPGRWGGLLELPVDPAAEVLTLKVRAANTAGSGSTITKNLTLDPGGDVPLYRFAPTGQLFNAPAPVTPGIYDPVLLAKSAAAPYHLSASQAGWHNTGVPVGTSLTPSVRDYRFTSGGPHLLEDLDITGSVYVEGCQLTIRRSRITNAGQAIQTGSGGLVVLEDCEVDGAGGGAQVKVGYSGITLRRTRVRRGVDLLRANTDVLVEDSFFTDLVEQVPYHNDCVQSDKGRNVVLRRSSFIAFNDGWQPGMNPGANSPLILKPDNGDITDYVVDSCVFGGGNAVYLTGHVDPGATNAGGNMVNLTFTNNVFHGDSLHADVAVNEDMGYLAKFRGNRRSDGGLLKVLVYKANGEAAIRNLAPDTLGAAT